MNNADNMTKYSLRSWVLVLALAPTILVGVLLGSYFTINRFYELEQTLIEQGSNIIEPLAIATAIGLERDDFESTKKLITATQLNKASLVQFIAIFDTNNRVVVTSHHYKNHEMMRYDQPFTSLLNTQLEQVGDSIILRTPIFSSDNELHLSPIDDTESERLVATKLGYIAVLINKENALLEQHRAAVAAFIIVLIGVQLNLLFTFRLVKNVTQPITDMVRVVAKIREGKLDTRVDGSLIGELDLLKRGINAMAGSLSEYHEEMQQNIDQATSDLRETLEQIEIQNVELDLAKKRALEASRIKSEFLANMSHELRTPLNGVIGFAKQLLKTPLHSSQQDYINTIEKSATNLLGIINDILDFSKLEAGKMILENMPFALRETLDDTITLLSNSAREKDIELVIDVDQSIPEDLSGDAMRFSQIITNLVGNAIKFTDIGSVHLKLQLTESSNDKINLRCEVIDTGIGIDEDQQEMLFQAFGQADSSISRRFGGTGLGLIITKRLINRMGGQIGCNSKPNIGSTFWFTLPLNNSQYPIGQIQAIDKLENKSVLLLEPRELSNNTLERQVRHWGMQLTNIRSTEQLESCLNQDDDFFDYALISNKGLGKDKDISSQLEQIKARCHYLIFICGDMEQELHSILPFVDKVMSAPIGEKVLAQTLIDPQPNSENYLLLDEYVAAEAISREALSVLAVDDNPANLKLIDTLLKELVSHVSVVNSGQGAIKLAQELSFDLIFMDIQMPGTDGISATKQIRQNSLNRNTPIIAVTAHAIAEERERIEQSGMDGYLPKPIDEASLKNVISRWKTRPRFTHFDQFTLNWDLCLTQANNKRDLALDMLKMLLNSLPETIESIQGALDRFDEKQMLASVHKLHGASCYCGVPTTQKLCQQIELSLKQGSGISEVEPEILELLDELTKVESAANQVISQLSMDILDDK
ncbi:two-component sensor histidine kinase BarA [Shewanella eurypsychrophilus]|uniref:histidine kinase n=1 Tax=Shewanella eurypsychrophilus TaxID=2593656 RepID=A0ABX6VDL2_9GAMM|nr:MULTISPECIES: two-component sensor histidine kinase BarA [Shewanella]QFU25398.1 two-component sensor histidine kinase BarA [Shewanella sp. YLB-09]QPG60540.1 two-component sensor histidine kinase BarA [Shewanella eurypsychrophilus]